MPRRPLVLLVEDDAAMARAVERALRGLGLDVEAFASGAEAIARVTRAPAPRVVWCDFDLGAGPTGADVLRAAAAARPTALLLHVSSTELEERVVLPARTLRFAKSDIGAATAAVAERVGLSGVRTKVTPRATKQRPGS